MDAITYLRQQHSKFRKTLAAISKASTGTTKLKKFKAFTQELQRHEKMEQTKWYPVLRKDKKLNAIIKHLLSEERAAAKAIKSFKKLEYGIRWQIKFMKFKHDVDHHAKEEEKKLFPKVRKYLTKSELNALGTKMRKFKAGLRKK